MQNPANSPEVGDPVPRSFFGIALGDLPLVIAQFVALTSGFSLAAHHLFSEDDRIHPAYIAGASFIAFMIVCWEVKVLLKSFYWLRGRHLLALGGLQLEPEKGGWWKMAIAGLLRIVMALVLTSIVMLCAMSAFFAKDERVILERLAQQQNAGLEGAAAARVDARISDKKSALADAMTRAASLSPKVMSLTVQAARSRLRRDGLDQLPALQSAMTGAEARVVQLQADLDHLTATRAEIIREDIVNAPNYVRPATGLLAEMQALFILSNEDPHARAVIMGFQASLICLELILFASKLIDVSPSGYAGHYAYRIYSEARRLAKKLSEELEATKGDLFPLPRTDVMPPTNDNNPAGAFEPGFGTLMAGDQAEGLDDPPPMPPRRPRGRPRKDTSFN